MQTEQIYKISIEDIENSEQAKPQIVYGSFFRRYLASAFDGLVSIILFIKLGQLTNYEPFGFMIAFGLSLLYFVVFESTEKCRATPGKLLMGLRVVRENGDCLSAWIAIVRFVSKYIYVVILFTGYVMALWRSKNQALHDSICSTCVIQYKKPLRIGWLVTSFALIGALFIKGVTIWFIWYINTYGLH